MCTQVRQWPYVLILATLFPRLLVAGTASGPNRPPNIIFILADDLGFNDVSWNNRHVKTPHMHGMVRHGVTLTQSYAQAACTPSRAAYLTGYYPFRTGVQNSVVREGMADYLPLDLTFLPKRLKEAGYSTHLVGKWHLGHCRRDVTPNARGFDTFLGLLNGYNDYYTKRMQVIADHNDFDPNAPGSVYDFFDNYTLTQSPETDYTTDIFTNRTIDLIRQQKDSPFFIALHYTAPHWPLEAPDKYLNKYRHVHDKNRKTYLAMVTEMDDGIGKIVKTLRHEKIKNNTVVIFQSDNGGAPGFGASNFPLRGQKAQLYEGGVRVPVFVYSPHLIRNTPRVSGDLFHMVDWFSTILGVAGISPGKQYEKARFWLARSEDNTDLGTTDAESGRDDFAGKERRNAKIPSRYISDYDSDESVSFNSSHSADYQRSHRGPPPPPPSPFPALNRATHNVDGVNQWPMLRDGSEGPRKTFIYNIFENNTGIRAGRYKLLEGDPTEFQARRRRRSVQSGTDPDLSGPQETPSSRQKRACKSRRPMESDMDKVMKAFNQLTGIHHLAEVRKRGGWTLDKILRQLETYRSTDVTEPVDCIQCQLYNLEVDPSETHNISGHYPAVALYLHRLLELYKVEEVVPVLKVPFVQDPRSVPSLSQNIASNTWCEPRATGASAK